MDTNQTLPLTLAFGNFPAYPIAIGSSVTYQDDSDVLKAIAMGARAVAIGKLQCWGLAADGQKGIVRVLEILEEEMRVAMGLLGVTSIDQLTQAQVCKAEPTTLPHKMSAWVNMPEDRIS